MTYTLSMTTRVQTSAHDLCDATGVHLRSCPLGALQALETVRHYHPTAAQPWLSADQATIYVRFPHSRTVYTYLVRPAGVPALPALEASA
jgi:hypothetical protein